MRSALPIPLLAALALPAPAAPIVMYLSRPPFVLIGGNVTVSVTADLSMVEGTYDYKYVPRFDYGRQAQTVSFEFPAFVPSGTDSLQAFQDLTRFKLKVDDVDFSPVDTGRLNTTLGPPPKLMPSGTKVMLAIFSVPRALLHERCILHVTYFQPPYRLAGQPVAALFPLLPDFDRLKNELLFSRDDFSVTFSALGDIRLKRLSRNRAVGRESPTLIEVHPVDRENIVVAVNPSAPSAAGPSTAR